MYLSKLSLCIIFVLLCSLESSANLNDDVPLTKLGSKTGPTLKFFYWWVSNCIFNKKLSLMMFTLSIIIHVSHTIIFNDSLLFENSQQKRTFIFVVVWLEKYFLQFLYFSYSCGYRKVYEDYVNILRQKYPELQIDGENYNPPGANMMLAKSLVCNSNKKIHFSHHWRIFVIKISILQGIAKILVIIIIFCKINIFQWIGQPQPFWWQWCMDNRLYSCVMLFFACNAAEGYLISSGAFEIHFNGKIKLFYSYCNLQQ